MAVAVWAESQRPKVLRRGFGAKLGSLLERLLRGREHGHWTLNWKGVLEPQSWQLPVEQLRGYVF